MLTALALVLLGYTVPARAADSAFVADSAANDTAADQSHVGPSLVYTMEINGAIGTVTAERVSDAISKCEEDHAELLVIYMDTPGGFTGATWVITKAILNSEVPVCIYIAPLGATAGSAGVYITYSAPFAAIVPTANIGAAHPVGSGGQDIDSVMNEKVTNDAAAKIRASAEKWGRNGVWGERAVRESVSLTAREALDSNVVNFIAPDLDSLLAQINGRTVQMPFGKKTMHLSRVEIKALHASFSQRILNLVTSPEIILLLFSLGSLGIVIELYNPGAIFPGVVGAICLILAFYGMQTLPINVAGLALIVLAIAMWIAEIKIVSHGLLFFGGLVSFFFGGLMLVDSVDPSLRISLSFLITLTIGLGIVFGLVVWLIIRAQRSRVTSGREGMIGKIAKVKTNDLVYVDGALWHARCDEPLTPGASVRIVSVDGLTLNVTKVDGEMK
jgi:membrane-bound serine protease (ClpP class)